MKFSLPPSKKQSDFYGPIFEVIQKYYPIGIKSESPAYQEYPGQIELSKIVIDNIHNKKNFKLRWKDFERQSGKELKKQIVGETYITRPSFSASLILKRFSHDELMHNKSLHFSVSLLGPYFTIYGIDETVIKDELDGHNLYYGAKNVVTVSPYKEYEFYFNELKSKIEDKFQGYKFIPFSLHSMFIEGLFDSLYDSKEATIYEALFDDALNGYDTIRMRGDSSYGYSEWVKD
jgi:hypothetical protein